MEENETMTWESEIQKTALKYHLLIAWISIILNPIWVIGDYLNVRGHFWDFFYIRISVSLLTVALLLLKNKFIKFPEIFALVPFIGISIQNAYMYSVMDILEIQKHTFAYIALFIGAGMFVLWHIKYSIIVVGVSFIANIVFFAIFGQLHLADVMVNGGLLVFSVAVFTILLIHTRTSLIKKEIIARLALEKSNEQLEEKNVIIQEQNSDIKSSLTYAHRIQNAILPPLEKIKSEFEDSFVFYKPKDIVSGDFYWYSKVMTTPKDKSKGEEICVIAAVDCTGHGVPGALMSTIGNAILNQSLSVKEVNTPAEALSFLNAELVKNLSSIKDGMDMALLAINIPKMKMQYAGANNPLYIVRNKELIEIKADKKSIGADFDDLEIKTFTNHEIKLEKGDSIYIFTDGYSDQFGGPESYNGGKKFKYKQFKDLLCSIQGVSMFEQKAIIETTHEKWKRNLEQVDDILVIGIKI